MGRRREERGEEEWGKGEEEGRREEEWGKRGVGRMEGGGAGMGEGRGKGEGGVSCTQFYSYFKFSLF